MGSLSVPPLSEEFTLRSYRNCRGALQIRLLRLLLGLACLSAAALPAQALDHPVRIVALGDSLTAGLGLPANASFPAKLEAALKAKGFAVEVINAGVSGDTAAAALARLDWSVPEGTDGVIVELGANDMLRGLDPQVTRKALDEIVRRLTARNVVVLLAGMRAAPNLGVQYGREFEGMFSELAAAKTNAGNLLFYPFFLDGIATQPKFNQADGVHPSASGVDEIVARILRTVEELIARVRQKHR
jgi:acyl-CoA thioesterase-1